MAVPFDPGYAHPPFKTLVEDVPDATVFPIKDFRVEWGRCSTGSSQDRFRGFEHDAVMRILPGRANDFRQLRCGPRALHLGLVNNSEQLAADLLDSRSH